MRYDTKVELCDKAYAAISNGPIRKHRYKEFNTFKHNHKTYLARLTPTRILVSDTNDKPICSRYV